MRYLGINPIEQLLYIYIYIDLMDLYGSSNSNDNKKIKNIYHKIQIEIKLYVTTVILKCCSCRF